MYEKEKKEMKKTMGSGKVFSKNFTLLVLGQVSSLFGNYIIKFALSMYVLDTTGSAAIFAGILSMATIPTILLSPLGGILADRANRRNIMVALDLLSGMSVLAVALLFRSSAIHRMDIAAIGALLVVLSVLGAFESPTVQACVPQMQTGDNIIKGNAVVNQVAAVASLIAPVLGGLFYTAVGIRPVMFLTTLCFFLTAGLECFIRLEYHALEKRERIGTVVKEDFKESMRFIGKEQPDILKMLLLATAMNFLVAGAVVVGLPFIVRNILGMSAGMYGMAESLMGLAAILGGITAGVLAGRKAAITSAGGKRFFGGIAPVGICFLLAGAAFLFPFGNMIKYAVNLTGFCGIQIFASVFSIFALSYIQQKTPNHLIGKVMSYAMAISMCAQPLSQAVYGILFDRFGQSVFLIFGAAGIVVLAIARYSPGVLPMNSLNCLEK